MRANKRGRGLAFTLGAIGYPLIELIWRGRTHWAMGVTGGGCLVLLRELQCRNKDAPLWRLALSGGLIITGVELMVGLFCNRLMGWKIWDYSHLPMQVAGQICLPFTLMWVALCGFLQPILDRLARQRPAFWHAI